MTRPSEKRILIPAAAPQRERLEHILRNDGWVPLSYQDTQEAEKALSRAPATAILLHTSGGEAHWAELVKTVRNICPDAFLLTLGQNIGNRLLGTVIGESSSPEEIATVARIGAEINDARVNERSLRKHLQTLQCEAAAQAKRIRELENTCRTLKERSKFAQELALHDELTSLYNRRYFFQAAEREIERARRNHMTFAAALIDIDHFKQYNDTYGHPAGDEILQQFARVLVGSLRRMDTVARYGGEEFIFLLPQTHEDSEMSFNPAMLVERLLARIESDASLRKVNRSSQPLTISAGVAWFPQDGRTVTELIAEVDARLYRAKAAGRNQICASGD